MHRSGEASGSARRRDGPFAPGRFRDEVGLVSQPLPRRPAGLLQGRDILEHAVREAVRFQEQNDLLHGIDLRIVGRQMQERQVGGNEKVGRAMPACAVRHDYAVGTRRHSRAVAAICSFMDAVLALFATWAMPPRRCAQVAPNR